MGDTIDKIAVLLACVLSLFGDGYYCYQSATGTITPTLATWVVFEVGSLLSLATYLRYNRKKHQLVSNVANFADPVVVAVVLAFVATAPRVDAKFRFWNFICLGIALAAAAVWRITRSDIEANIVSQFVMIVGYAPTVLGMIRERRNAESFPMWIAGLAIALLLLIPPVRHRNWLGVLYIGRAAVCIVILLAVMTYFQYFEPR